VITCISNYDACRSQLAAKEALLVEAEAALEVRDAELQTVCEQFEPLVAKLTEGKKQLDAQESHMRAEREVAESKEAELRSLAKTTQSRAEALRAKVLHFANEQYSSIATLE